MKLLLIVGTANDIFIYNYAKWLKSSMDVTIDVFEVYPSSRQGYDSRYYDDVQSANRKRLPFCKVTGLIDPALRSCYLSKFLKEKKYDIIHVHWITSPVVLQTNLHKHCHKLALTFWGGEFVQQKILFSKKLYRNRLNALTRQVDCIINEKNGIGFVVGQLPCFRGEQRYAELGSAPLEALYNLMDVEGKEQSKGALGLPADKLIVQIGYSGKKLHRHLDVLKEIEKYPELKTKVHLLAPMTRGADDSYIELVDSELKRIGFGYTLLRGHFLSDEEVARLRNATDIVLQLSEFDGFSRSIIECLCAKSLLIYGDWLGYDSYMEPIGFEGLKVPSLETGVKTLCEVIPRLDEYDDIRDNNSIVGRKRTLWSSCIHDWVTAYKELMEE